MKNLLKLTTILLTLNVSALTFIDSQNILGEVDDFTGKKNFNTSFVLGERADYSVSSCYVGSDVIECSLGFMELELVDKTDRQIYFESRDSEGDYQFSYSKNKLQEFDGNVIKLLLAGEQPAYQSLKQQIDNSLELSGHGKSIQDEGPHTVVIDSGKLEVIEYKGENLIGMKVEFTMVWDNGFIANGNVKLIQGQSFLNNIFSYEFDMMGLANVQVELSEYSK